MWQTFPVFVINRDRLTTTRRLVEWLQRVGCRNIHILDNQSSYPPLLSWYAAVQSKITVHRSADNLGPWGFWKMGLHARQASPYVVTDSDLFPASFCPDDLIAQLLRTLEANPGCGKVGAGLRVDSLPEHYSRRQTAFDWECQFWQRPIQQGLFHAHVDTTFAIYPAGGDYMWSPTNIRRGYPYLMEHLPWHVNDRAIDEEEHYYRQNSRADFVHWGSAANDPKMERIENTLATWLRPSVLHLGGGNEYIPGWINIDAIGRKLDLRFDFSECRSRKLPIADDSVDGFYSCHLLERVEDPHALMQELHRVARPGARFFTRMRYGEPEDAGTSRAWFEDSFIDLAQPGHMGTTDEYSGDWHCERVTLVAPASIVDRGPREALGLASQEPGAVLEMIVELRAVKPKRGRNIEELTDAEVVITSDPCIEPRFETA